jgi:hypothetical protein
MRKTYVIEIETDCRDIVDVLHDLGRRAANELCDGPSPTIVAAYELDVDESTIVSTGDIAEFETFSLDEP